MEALYTTTQAQAVPSSTTVSQSILTPNLLSKQQALALKMTPTSSTLLPKVSKFTTPMVDGNPTATVEKELAPGLTKLSGVLILPALLTFTAKTTS